MAISFFGESKRRKVRPATKLSHTLKESKKNRQHNGKKKRTKQRSTKHHSENLRSSNKNSIKNPG